MFSHLLSRFPYVAENWKWSTPLRNLRFTKESLDLPLDLFDYLHRAQGTILVNDAEMPKENVLFLEVRRFYPVGRKPVAEKWNSNSPLLSFFTTLQLALPFVEKLQKYCENSEGGVHLHASFLIYLLRKIDFMGRIPTEEKSISNSLFRDFPSFWSEI